MCCSSAQEGPFRDVVVSLPPGARPGREEASRLLLHLLRAAALAALLVLVSAPALAAKAVALLIGNAEYTHERKLRNPVNDAELLGAVLKNDLKFDDVRVERNLGVAGMDRAIASFVERAKDAETVFFYYSGHGMKKSANDRRNFLLPVDARTGTADALDLERQAVAAEAVRDRLKLLGAKVTLLVLDACRDGPGGGRSGTKGLSRNGGGNQLLVAYATEEDQVAEDGAGRNSTYAAALAQALKRPEPLLAQLDWVADEVQRLVPGQSPTRDGNLRHNAYLVSPFAPVTADNRARIEDEAWALCRQAGTVQPCQDYISGWPQGRYLALARTRWAELQAPPVKPPTLAAGQVLKECAACPEMVVVPAGTYDRGSTVFTREMPVRPVTVAAFALGKYEVTVEEYLACVQAGVCREPQWRERGSEYHYQTGSDEYYRKLGDALTAANHPIVGVSHEDAAKYAAWISAQTGRKYRLPSEAEWEYAARAGSKTAYSWGDEVGRGNANCDGCGSRWDNMTTAPMGQFKANAFGLHDMHGNVWEWVQDVWHDSYQGAPEDGSAWVTGGDQARRVHRGGSWFNGPSSLRSANRYGNAPDFRNYSTGFRIARTL